MKLYKKVLCMFYNEFHYIEIMCKKSENDYMHKWYWSPNSDWKSSTPIDGRFHTSCASAVCIIKYWWIICIIFLPSYMCWELRVFACKNAIVFISELTMSFSFKACNLPSHLLSPVLGWVCWILQLTWNCCDTELTEICAINASNVQTSKTAVQVILWVSLLVQYRSLEPREALCQ